MSTSQTTSSPLGNAARLRGALGLVFGELVRAGERLVEHPRLAEIYPEYLFTGHTIIRTSVPLMETARERALGLATDDPLAAELVDYLAQHIEEERDHDEWLLDDLELLGLERRKVLAHVPSATIARLVGAQYYWVLHYHPVALLGYFAVMEGYPPPPALVEDLIARTGYPREAFRTFAEHGELDPHHREELDEALDSLPLTREHEIVVGLSAMATAESLGRSIAEVLEELPAYR